MRELSAARSTSGVLSGVGRPVRIVHLCSTMPLACLLFGRVPGASAGTVPLILSSHHSQGPPGSRHESLRTSVVESWDGWSDLIPRTSEKVI